MTSISVHQKAVCGSGPVLLESSSPTAQAYGTLLSGPARQGPDYAPLVSSGPVPSTTPPNQSILFLAPKTTTPPRGQAGPDRVQASCWCSRNGWESEQQRMHMGANGRPSSCLPLTTVNIHELTCLAAMMVVVSTAAFWRWHRRYLPVRLVAAGWRDSASKPASQPAVDMVAWQRERRETSGKTFSLPLLLCVRFYLWHDMAVEVWLNVWPDRTRPDDSRLWLRRCSLFSRSRQSINSTLRRSLSPLARLWASASRRAVVMWLCLFALYDGFIAWLAGW
ncbi:hypothetical protein HDK77DRAFT_113070 [Phyllosticta capitalensis]|uniref:Uncharacterized protein n=1 Tax=Phyllosticta capitalensis TaxID=121624 RepID=A0ABR1YQ69_9PEZI